MTAASSSKSSLKVSTLAPVGAIGVMLTPWGLSFLRALLLEPIRINPPTWLRLLLSLLVITNIRSTPFAWHFRVLFPAFKAVFIARNSLLRKAPSTSPSLTHPSIHPQLKLSKLPIGRDIFGDYSDHHMIATLDECDWNGHLSNSSYSKALDYTRMAHNSPRVLKVYYDGGWVALGGSGFNFHREVPMLARYTIRMSLEAWDDKWLYVVGRFVKPSSSSKPIDATTGLREGEMLYCTSVSRYVCKSNRRTIPPWLWIATSGYGAKSNWDKAEKLRVHYLEKARNEYRAKTGKKTISKKADAKLRKSAALLKQFRTEGEKTGAEEEAWMDKSFWDTHEWEQKRKVGLAKLGATVGILPPLEK
ncbi:hypothetical protein PSEUBRA_003867 [Kalmanozyma brasiliensis GHG001]|uniref:Thioesterase n=1 Tax=Kalmanozyma brasiliensis (strain GHG001) TaxID=1365824 RepID=V5EV09_KALBG|nr:uncharacterized protein PSEUBRA_003867 [Kalmanozyma brasiliensis GHG001]EST06014.1 hypothetical protein PSEUBRA_003867 [Kalmanozyma brasiliensis GHG001]